MTADILPFRCDVNGCSRIPYVEVISTTDHCWSYLCFWHYILDRLKRHKDRGYCKVNKSIQVLHEIRDTVEYLDWEIEEIKKILEERK